MDKTLPKLQNISIDVAEPFVQWYRKKQPHRCALHNVAGSGFSAQLTHFFQTAPDSHIVFCATPKIADRVYAECQSFIGQQNVLLFADRESIPFSLRSPFGPITEARLKTLDTLLNGDKKLIIAPISTLFQPVADPKDLYKRCINISLSQSVELQTLADWLTEAGFRRENAIEGIGTFAIRGDIVDIYPFVTDHPVRIEFFGEEVESIRLFDVFTNRSVSRLDSIRILPMREFTYSRKMIAKATERLSTKVTGTNDFRDKLIQSWTIANELEGIEWFSHLFDLPQATILDYLTDQSSIWFYQTDSLPDTHTALTQNYTRHRERLTPEQQQCVAQTSELLYEPNELTSQCSLFKSVLSQCDKDNVEEHFSAGFQPQGISGSNIEIIRGQLHTLLQQNYNITLVSESSGHARRLGELLGEGFEALNHCTGWIEEGFYEPQSRFALFSSRKLLGQRTQKPSRVRRSKSGEITRYDALTPGDLVVHEEHGVGKFIGIEQISIQDGKRDCMVLQYQDKARLYVPIEDFSKVQKYIGAGEASMSLAKIGSGAWQKTKKKTKKALEEMAHDIIALYAKRMHLPGIAFDTDTVWQQEFEEAFVYEPTADQIRAIEEIKKDMHKPHPMDRLVCGDVGFGKTEVAMRAAFKAASAGYQVAVLAPTTILAAQHQENFQERMNNFSVSIALLSRLQSAREQKAVLQKVADGQVDILIGTHRILSADVQFKKLGLLIIDEEQRFGVRHKDRLKQMRFQVDVLSMTATPIPRTLHMSLIGSRDLSIINTPPQNRLPVETRVTEYREDIIANAIEYEMDRGGQVFFVNNRIQTLAKYKDIIEMLVPKARVVIAHGQMSGTELDRIMHGFVAGSYDVLLSTVLIENGIDIPNVNTIIINRADTMGLSQLYQLRGRVGRSSEQAFAYLLTAPRATLHNNAKRRLHALEQYTELGSGFQIAMRDLELRGAGNILGEKQHGQIAAVGFEMYCKLLKETIDEIKFGKKSIEEPGIKIDTPLEAYIPTTYIADAQSRIEVYQYITSFTDSKQAAEYEQTLGDRFGPLPQSVTNIFILMELKRQAQRLQLSKIAIHLSAKMSLTTCVDPQKQKSVLESLLSSRSCAFSLKYETPPVAVTPIGGKTATQQAEYAVELLQGLPSPKIKQPDS